MCWNAETEEKVNDNDVDDVLQNIPKIPFITESTKSKATKSKGKFNLIIYHMWHYIWKLASILLQLWHYIRLIIADANLNTYKKKKMSVTERIVALQKKERKLKKKDS